MLANTCPPPPAQGAGESQVSGRGITGCGRPSLPRPNLVKHSQRVAALLPAALGHVETLFLSNVPPFKWADETYRLLQVSPGLPDVRWLSACADAADIAARQVFDEKGHEAFRR